MNNQDSHCRCGTKGEQVNSRRHHRGRELRPARCAKGDLVQEAGPRGN
jgi:hypothetical protein